MSSPFIDAALSTIDVPLEMFGRHFHAIFYAEPGFFSSRTTSAPVTILAVLLALTLLATAGTVPPGLGLGLDRVPKVWTH